MSIDRGNDWLAEIPHPHQRIEVEPNEPVPVSFILGSIRCKLVWIEVKPSRKRLSPRSRKYNDASFFVCIDRIEHIAEFGQQPLRKRVVLLWPVESNRRNLISFL